MTQINQLKVRMVSKVPSCLSTRELWGNDTIILVVDIRLTKAKGYLKWLPIILNNRVGGIVPASFRCKLQLGSRILVKIVTILFFYLGRTSISMEITFSIGPPSYEAYVFTTMNVNPAFAGGNKCYSKR